MTYLSGFKDLSVWVSSEILSSASSSGEGDEKSVWKLYSLKEHMNMQFFLGTWLLDQKVQVKYDTTAFRSVIGIKIWENTATYKSTELKIRFEIQISVRLHEGEIKKNLPIAVTTDDHQLIFKRDFIRKFGVEPN